MVFTKKFDPSELSDLTGKVAIVTGGNVGLGYATVRHLARRNAKVYLASRSEDNIAAAIERLESDGIGDGEVRSLKLDLSDPRTAKAAAEEFLDMEDRLDILINNAACFVKPYDKNVDDVVDVMMINLFGPFVFTQNLLPLMKQTANEPDADVRIVNLAAHAHHMITPNEAHFKNMDDINQEFAKTFYPAFTRFAFSKLAVILWTRELQKRLDAEAAPIIVTCVHPGVADTSKNKLPSLIKPLGFLIMKLFFTNPNEGSHTSVIAAASPDVRGNADMYKGAYLEPVGKVTHPSKVAQNAELSHELWATAETFLSNIGLN